MKKMEFRSALIITGYNIQDEVTSVRWTGTLYASEEEARKRHGVMFVRLSDEATWGPDTLEFEDD